MAELFTNISGMFYTNNRYSTQIRRKKRNDNLKVYSATFLISFLYYYALEMCNRNWLFNGFLFTFVNIFMIYGFIYILGLIFVKRWIGAIVGGAVTTVIAIINFYTVLYRNQPASPLDIHNAGTALSVLGSYDFILDIKVVLAILLYAGGVCLAVLWLKKLENKKENDLREYLVRLISTVSISLIFLYVVFFASFSLKPKFTLVWSWEESYHKYGYLALSEEMLVKSFNTVKMPYGYDEEGLRNYAEKNAAAKKENERKPDIILIMNETYFDLSNVLKLETDKSVTPFIDSLENSVKGYSIVPGSGGGTNRSEYELLTSNSLTLMPDITPFAFLNLENADSIVSFLEAKGYTTVASHCAGDLNYARGVAYPKLGFDKSVFIEDFEVMEKYGDRPYATDKCVYEQMIMDYNRMDDGPRFLFNLTIQNHGDWNLNKPEDDIIHAKGDFGEYADQVNEYLSCVSLTDSAFEWLVNYYKNVDRDVIICMVGDHSPVFTPEIAKVDYKNQFEYLKLYATPFVMWANFDIPDADLGYTSMPYIVPLTLKYSGLNLSPFYDLMLKMYNKFPAVTATNNYLDKNNNVIYYDDSEKAPEIKTYFDMVYNRAINDKNKIEKLYAP